MSEAKRGEMAPEEEQKAGGPNLTLIFTLIVLAMIAAIAVAAFIVLPFYRHR